MDVGCNLLLGLRAAIFFNLPPMLPLRKVSKNLREHRQKRRWNQSTKTQVYRNTNHRANEQALPIELVEFGNLCGKVI